ncbi:MAG TPA: DUF2752 domain-containing protein [bacterium]|nr:DUF2752 domain-containing protein [bacterium]
MGRGSLLDPDRTLWACCVLAVGASLLLAPSALPSLDLCWFKSLTHHPCPGCGLTHSFLAIGHGRWAEAWADNPFGYVWYALAIYGALRPVLRRAVPGLARKADGWLGSGPFFPLLVGVMILVWLVRSFA